MKTRQPAPGVFTGEILEESLVFTIEDLCRNCSLEITHVISLVEEGVLQVAGEDQAHWRFEPGSVRRVRTAMRLQRDLGVNLAGAALALELLDRIATLERQMSAHS